MIVTGKGQVVVTVTCVRCGRVRDRLQNYNQDEPAKYCGRNCQQRAKRRRAKTGTSFPRLPSNPRRPCPGCGQMRKLRKRGDIAVCTKCRERLHGCCMRKTPYGTEEAAVAFAVENGLDQGPYRCPLCQLVHLTRDDTVDAIPGDGDLGERLRAAGFTRDPVR